MRVLQLFSVILGTAVILPGCGRTQPEFSHRDDYYELIPSAQVVVEDTLLEHYGTPTDMVAWEKLPLKFSIASGRVTAVEGDAAAPSTLQVTLFDGASDIKPGQTVDWLSGNLLPESGEEYTATREVASYDPQTSTLTLDAPLPAAPEPGDRFVVDLGGVMRAGRHLYAEHCQHCHGVSGDGAGPTARYLNPRPRDYRLGKFKFTSTQTSNRATREDLSRVIENGIPGTYMPSFKLLEPDEMQAIVEYVLWLSMRGETELNLVTYFGEFEDAEEVQEYVDEDFKEEFEDDISFLARRWEVSQEPSALVIPKEGRVDMSPESLERGRKLYLSDKAKCASCHGTEGLGNGPQTLAVQKDPDGNEYEHPGLYDDWGNPLKPRNLRTGIYRGGRRPIDLYRRIYAGIKGTPMPAFGTALSDQEIWDIVNYVMSVPFEKREPGDGAKPYTPPEQLATASPE
ncbi:MAG: c-type cytochrome [Maioricimonas sp. JB045]